MFTSFGLKNLSPFARSPAPWEPGLGMEVWPGAESIALPSLVREGDPGGGGTVLSSDWHACPARLREHPGKGVIWIFVHALP